MNRFKNIFSASNPYKRLKKSNAKETKGRVEEFCSAFLRSYVSVVSISTEWKQMITEDSVKRKYILRYLKSNFHRSSHCLGISYYVEKIRGHRSRWNSAQMDNWHQWQLKKSKSWGLF